MAPSSGQNWILHLIKFYFFFYFLVLVRNKLILASCAGKFGLSVDCTLLNHSDMAHNNTNITCYFYAVRFSNLKYIKINDSFYQKKCQCVDVTFPAVIQSDVT